MCQGWTVHQVLAHMVAVAGTSPAGFVRKLAAAGFSFPRAQDRGIAEESAGGPSATLQRFRQVQASTAAPPGPRLSWLGETLVHAEDIRRPLGLAHQYPTRQVTRLLNFYARSNLPVGARRRIRGLSLAATDTDWQRGHGPLVEGPAMSLLMAAAGRRAASADLKGPGVAILQSR